MAASLRAMAALTALGGAVQGGSSDSFLQIGLRAGTDDVPEHDLAQLSTVPDGQLGWQGFHGRCVDDEDQRVADNGRTDMLPPGEDVSQCMVNCRGDEQCQAVHAFFWASPADEDLWNVVCKYVSSYYQDPVVTGPATGGWTDKVPPTTECNICFINEQFEPTTTTTVAPSCPTSVPADQEGWEGFEGRCVDEDDQLVADNGTEEQLPAGQDVSECMVRCSADSECQAVHASFRASPSDPNVWNVVCKYVSSSYEDPEETGPAVGGRDNDVLPAYTDCSVCFVKPTYQSR